MDNARTFTTANGTPGTLWTFANGSQRWDCTETGTCFGTASDADACGDFTFTADFTGDTFAARF